MRVRGVLLVAGIAALLASTPAQAAKYNVTGTADPGTCDGLTCSGIRAAINAAVITKGVDDEIDLKKANYLLGSQLTISDGDSLAIVGVGADQTIVNGGKKARVFNVVSGKVSLSHLTATGGAVNDLSGAGILNTAQLTLDHVRVTDSTGTASSGGGGIANSGSLSIANSLIDGNATTGDGGGIYNLGTADTGASLSIRDSTISGNTAAGRIGFGGISSRGNDGNTVNLQRVSVADNTGGSTGAGGLGGVQGTFNVRASIAARNTLASGAAANCAGTITDLGSNLESGTDCGFKDKPNSNPGFAAAPVDAGGETPVYRIPATSPAVDLAPACTGVTDQRDVQRPQGKGCDAGAYEYDQDVSIDGGPTGLTSDRNPQFPFSSPEPNPVFECKLDGPGATIGSFASCTPPRSYAGLADGAYTFSLRALAGGPVVARSFTVDTTPPAAPLFTSPANNSFQQSRSISPAGTAEIGSTVTVMEGTTTLGTVATNQSGAWTLPTLTNVPDGTHTYRATAQDAAGNTGAESTRVVTVDNAAPTAPTVTTPATTPTIQNSATVQFAGTGETAATVQIFEGATLKTTATVTGGNWSASLSGVADAQHVYTINQKDRAGNTSPNVSRTITVDTVAPNTTIGTKPATLGNVRDVSFAFTSSEGGPSFQCRLNTGTTTNCGSPIQYQGLADGNYTFRVAAVDAAGNVDASPDTFAFTVDGTPPAAPALTAPADNSTTKSASVAVSGTAEAGATITVLDGGTPVAGTVTVAGNGTWSKLVTAADGAHTFTATAKDAAGNTSAASTARHVTVDTHAPNAPLINSPAENALLNSTTVALAGTAETGSTVKVLEGTTLKASGTAAGGNWTLNVTGAADGTHTYTVTATDAAGNESAAATRKVRVDTGPPAAPLITGPAALVNAHGFALTGTAEPGAIVTVLEGATVVGTATADDGGAWTLALAGVTDGVHTYTTRAEDVAHNTSPLSAARTVTVDTSAPVADVTGGPSGPTTDSAPAFPFSSTDAASTFECRLDGPSGQGTFVPCASPKSYSGLPPGDYTFFLRAIDPAGNATVTSRSFTVTVVQQAPPTPTFHQSVVVQPAGGKVLIKRKGSKVFVALVAGQGIPLGSEVDTRHGKVQLSSVPRKGGPVQTALFYDGLFVVTQVGGITNLRLSEPLAKCPTGKAASAAAKKKKPKSRRLWGDGSGAFRTQGRYSAATVRGTKWLVQDSCPGTLTRVARGVIQVNDFVRHKKLVLRKGKHYTAKPKKRR